MSVLSTILVTLVALEFFYILYLETFATQSPATARVFKLSPADLQHKALNTLFKNQGVYNGFIGTALLYGAYGSANPKEIVALLLINIIVVACYGGLTADKSIILKQGGLAIVALLSLLF